MLLILFVIVVVYSVTLQKSDFYRYFDSGQTPEMLKRQFRIHARELHPDKSKDPKDKALRSEKLRLLKEVLDELVERANTQKTYFDWFNVEKERDEWSRNWEEQQRVKEERHRRKREEERRRRKEAEEMRRQKLLKVSVYVKGGNLYSLTFVFYRIGKINKQNTRG